MNKAYSFPMIGIIHSCFKEKFGIPRQPGLAPLAKAQLELLAPYNDPAAVEGLQQVSHLWIQFVFHANEQDGWKPKVRPPRLGGNRSLGVFATRSPFRPSPIGLSVVKLDSIQQESNSLILHLSGVDLLDGTPVLDIKPYVPYVDLVMNAENQLAADAPKIIEVVIPDFLQAICQQYELTQQIPLHQLIQQILQQDPKPAYQQPNTDKIYGMRLLDLNIQWRYQDPQTIELTAIEP